MKFHIARTVSLFSFLIIGNVLTLGGHATFAQTNDIISAPAYACLGTNQDSCGGESLRFTATVHKDNTDCAESSPDTGECTKREVWGVEVEKRSDGGYNVTDSRIISPTTISPQEAENVVQNVPYYKKCYARRVQEGCGLDIGNIRESYCGKQECLRDVEGISYYSNPVDHGSQYKESGQAVSLPTKIVWDSQEPGNNEQNSGEYYLLSIWDNSTNIPLQSLKRVVKYTRNAVSFYKTGSEHNPQERAFVWIQPLRGLLNIGDDTESSLLVREDGKDKNNRLEDSEYNIREELGMCFLKPNNPYRVEVTPCVDECTQTGRTSTCVPPEVGDGPCVWVVKDEYECGNQICHGDLQESTSSRDYTREQWDQAQTQEGIAEISRGYKHQNTLNSNPEVVPYYESRGSDMYGMFYENLIRSSFRTLFAPELIGILSSSARNTFEQITNRISFQFHQSLDEVDDPLEDPDWAGPRHLVYGGPLSQLSISWCPIDIDSSREGIQRPYTWVAGTDVVGGTPSRVTNPEQKDIRNVSGRTVMFLFNNDQTRFPSIIQNSVHRLFTRHNTYTFDVAPCDGTLFTQGNCSYAFGQEWQFHPTANLGPSRMQSPEHNANAQNPLSNLEPIPLSFLWDSPIGAYYNRFILESSGGIVLRNEITDQQPRIDSPDLELDTSYAWSVTPCWLTYARQDETQSDHSVQRTRSGVLSYVYCEGGSVSQGSFRTTGRAPQADSLNAEGLLNPIMLSWEHVQNAGSYLLEISRDGDTQEVIVPAARFASQDEATLTLSYQSFPDIISQNSSYAVSIRTCADGDGELCGEQSSSLLFETGELAQPQNITPDEILFSHQLPARVSWNDVQEAEYYHYTLSYESADPLEINPSCELGVLEDTVTTESTYPFSHSCLGTYTVQVSACLDEECESEVSEEAVSSFTLQAATEEIAQRPIGFVACGRNINHPATPWDERDPCGFIHIFVSIKLVLDFLFGNLLPIVIILSVALSGAAMQIYAYDEDMPQRVRSWWSSILKGTALIVMSWFLVAILMYILGYQFGIFGQWWQIG